MKRECLVYTVFFLLCYLGFLAGTVPAAWVWERFRPAVPAGVEIAGIGGTLFAGRAAVLRTRFGELKEVGWRLDPLPLLLGRVAVRLRTAGAVELRGGAEWRRGGVAVEGLSGRAAAAALRAPVPLAGDLEFQDLTVEFADGRFVRAGGRIRWRRAGIGDWTGLGGLRADLGARDGALVARLAGEEGLELAADLTLSPDGGVRIRGTARPRSPDQKTVFALLGPAGADGRVRIDYNGRPWGR